MLVLIGLRGSGKTTLGRRLAGELDRRFVDLDDVTAAAMGEPDPGKALRAHGVERFRDAEGAALREALSVPGGVLALGGGTPTAPGARETLDEAQRAARVSIAYLRADAPTLRARLQRSDVDRPALISDDPLAEIEALLEQRDELYKQIANGVIDVGGIDEALALEYLLDWARGV